MDSKAAVREVLARGEPGYIPFGAYAIDCDTVRRVIGRETYVRNKVATQLALWDGRRDEVAQSVREDSVALFNKLPSVDVIIPFKEGLLLPPAGYEPEKVKKISDNTYESESGYIYRVSAETNEVAVVKYPEREYTAESFVNAGPPAPPDPTIFEAYNHLVEAFKDTRYLAGQSAGLGCMPLLGGMEDGLVRYYTEPETVKACIDWYVRNENALDKYYINDGIDGVFVETDAATTRAPFMSPAMFREFCFPAMKKRIENIKRFKPDAFFHSCGYTAALMDMFIDAGVGCYQSIQTGTGMDIKFLKDNFGDRISFWGGVAVELLIAGTTEEVRADVRRAMEAGKRDGGFILGPSHSVAYGSNYDNFMAMLDEHDKLKYL